MLQVRQIISLVTSHPYLPFSRHIIPILHDTARANPTQRVLPHSLMNKSQELTVFHGRQKLISAVELRPESYGKLQI